MVERISLQQSTLPQPIPGTGIEVLSTGLLGELVCYSAVDAGNTRAGGAADSAPLAEALAEAGLTAEHVLAIDAPTPDDNSNAAPVRAGTEPPANELRLDISPSPNEVLFAVYQDEAGVLSLHLPVSPAEAAQAAQRGDGVKTITIRLRPAAAPATDTGTRSIGGTIVRKLVILVARTAADRLLPKVEYAAVRRWEERMRAFQGLHRGDTPEELLAEAPVRAEPAYLRTLAGQPALLFIHGTTSSTRGAFGSLSGFPDLAKVLWQKYGGRVIAFNHHTLSKSVAANVVDFFQELPAEHEFIFDAVVHSRGGLVARAIAGLADTEVARHSGRSGPWQRTARVRIRRTIFVGTPNNGTDLADPENLPTMLNWLANVAGVFPGAAAVALGAILSVAAYVGETGLKVLPGLADQAVDADGHTGALLTALNDGAADAAGDAFGIEAQFQPAGRLLAAVAAFAVAKAFRDRANDLVVPSEGISAFGLTRFAAGRVKTFSPSDGHQVHHTNYFGAADTWKHILAALT